ncbi:hypothetical protein KJ951_02785 [Patescibacteria group bacterium]|nr:hypothetical protein [Patescibacteria group bacterium]MBU1703306.1 hypothetical protein [Patescibacteria group bacterium]MBU1954379.1 hypothetical protein [Patescibacteria group bacterium]
MADLDRDSGWNEGANALEGVKQDRASISYIGRLPTEETHERAMTVLEQAMEQEPNLQKAINQLAEMPIIDTTPLLARINRRKDREPAEIYRHIVEYVKTLLHCLKVKEQKCRVIYAHPDPSFDLAARKFAATVVNKPGSFDIEKLKKLDDWLGEAWSRAYWLDENDSDK